MLYKVKVQETQVHEIIVEAATAKEAAVSWLGRYDDEDFDEITTDHAYVIGVEEAE